MSDTAPKVTADFDTIRIHFGNALHFWFKRDELLGFQSWRWDDGTRFIVQYIFKGGAICCEYDKPDKWESILKQLDELL